jgi:hypothetical protein
MKLNKTAIAPIVSSAFLAVTFVTGHHFSNGTVELVTDIVVAVATFGVNMYGIVKNHKKEVK